MDFNQFRIVELLKERDELLEALKREHGILVRHTTGKENSDCPVCQLIRRVEG